MIVFVTVGTTSFDDLIAKVTSAATKQIFQDCGYTRLIIQLGRGKVRPQEGMFGELQIQWYDYKPSIACDIAMADLIISHAGAGSCLEVLGEKKPLIVVVNEKLMNNHQYELAERLSKGPHLLYCSPSVLNDAIRGIKRNELIDLQAAKTEKFSFFMDNYFGLL